MAPQDLMSTKQKPHQTWMSYVKTAISHHFGVLDVNIPEHITMTSNPPTSTTNPNLDSAQYANTSVSFADHNNDLARREAERLATYLWENYIEPYDFEHIFLVGAGNAYHGVGKLVSEHETVYERITAVFGFIHENPVRVVGNPNNPWLSSWYRENSRIFVAADHALWSKDRVSKRYGTLVRGPPDVHGLNGLMAAFHDQVWTGIRARIGGTFEDEDEDEDVDGKGGGDTTEEEDNDDGVDDRGGDVFRGNNAYGGTEHVESLAYMTDEQADAHRVKFENGLVGTGDMGGQSSAASQIDGPNSTKTSEGGGMDVHMG